MARQTLYQSVVLNLVLATFNMLPIPPLDGGRILVSIMPGVPARPYAKLERFGLLILLGLVFLVPMIARQVGLELNLLVAPTSGRFDEDGPLAGRSRQADRATPPYAELLALALFPDDRLSSPGIEDPRPAGHTLFFDHLRSGVFDLYHSAFATCADNHRLWFVHLFHFGRRGRARISRCRWGRVTIGCCPEHYTKGSADDRAPDHRLLSITDEDDLRPNVRLLDGHGPGMTRNGG